MDGRRFINLFMLVIHRSEQLCFKSLPRCIIPDDPPAPGPLFLQLQFYSFLLHLKKIGGC